MARDWPDSKTHSEWDRKSSPAVLFLCLARNCASTLPAFFSFLRALRESGINASAWIGENGSTDQTARLIEGTASAAIVRIDTAPMAESSERLQRMAIGRQVLLDALRQSGLKPRYVCVADLDDTMSAPPAPRDLIDAMQQLEDTPDLFAVGATSRPLYYDLLSLRLEGFEFLHDLHDRIQEAKRKPLTYYQFQKRHIYAVQRSITLRIPMRCTSSFNGMCLYRGEDYLLGSYRSAEETSVCEHVTFNSSIAAAAHKQMAISAGLALNMPADHTPVGPVRFYLDRVRKKLH